MLIRFGWRAFRLGRWYEAATAAAAVVSLALLCTQFTGSTGVRNTPRLYEFLPVCALFFVPLALAFWLYYGGSHWRPAGSTNKGDLIDPAVPLPAVAGSPLIGRQRHHARLQLRFA